MKFQLHDNSEEPVIISTRKIHDGSVAILADGITILWLETDGTIRQNTCEVGSRLELGFELDEDDKIVVK